MQRLLSVEDPHIDHSLHSLSDIPSTHPDYGRSWRAAPSLLLATVLLATLPSTSSAATQQPANHAEALQHLENLYDSTVTDNSTRAELRAKFAALRPKVSPNTDPKKAGLWKVKAFAFRELDFTWQDSQGAQHHAQYRYRRDELDRLHRGMAAFADRVWRFTDGNLRIDWTLEIVEKPLTRLDGDDSFWPGPDACMPYLSDLKPGQADTIMVFAKVFGDPSRGEQSAEVPQMLLGGALGALGDLTKNATYIAFNWAAAPPPTNRMASPCSTSGCTRPSGRSRIFRVTPRG